MSDTSTLRVDKWLWYTRLFKSRALAARAVTSGQLRVNRKPVDKASAPIRIGDVLTLRHPAGVRVIEVRRLGTRRGPAPEARELYLEIVAGEAGPASTGAHKAGAGVVGG